MGVVSRALQASSDTGPRPLSIGPSQVFDGNDGRWSTFNLQLGHPVQNVRVLVSTSSSAAWAIGADLGCPAGLPVANCADARGGLYSTARSLTYLPNSVWDLGVEGALGLDKSAAFGFEDAALGFQNAGAGAAPPANHSVLATVGDPAYWLGVVGLNPRPSNFSSLDSPQPSLLQLLKDARAIPSLSYAYAAGAAYRQNGVFASLTLGGLDQALLDPARSISIPFAADISQDLTVAIHAIHSRAVASSADAQLLPQPIYALVDSTLPDLWLPTAACLAFEAAFGLSYNASSNLYLLSEPQHDALVAANPSVSFLLGPSADPGSPAVNISLPYAAFDLNASWPIVPAPSVALGQRYFPLKRAANATQHRLGRAFLQEAYLIADYERQNFTLGQRRWTDAPQHLVAIGVPDTDASSSQDLSFNTIAGIVIGCVAAILLALFVAMMFIWRWRRQGRHRRRRRRRHGGPLSHTPGGTTDLSSVCSHAHMDPKDTTPLKLLPRDHAYRARPASSRGTVSLDSSVAAPPAVYEIDSNMLDREPMEIDGRDRHLTELPGSVSSLEQQQPPPPSKPALDTSVAADLSRSASVQSSASTAISYSDTIRTPVLVVAEAVELPAREPVRREPSQRLALARQQLRDNLREQSLRHDS